MWELTGKLQNENSGKYTCKDLFVDEGDVAPFCSPKLKIEHGDIGRGVFGQNIRKGELLVAGPAIGTGKSVEQLSTNLKKTLNFMPLSTTLQLQYLKGGLHEEKIPNFDVYCAPLT
jgi:hypothetical protein